MLLLVLVLLSSLVVVMPRDSFLVFAPVADFSGLVGKDYFHQGRAVVPACRLDYYIRQGYRISAVPAAEAVASGAAPASPVPVPAPAPAPVVAAAGAGVELDASSQALKRPANNARAQVWKSYGLALGLDVSDMTVEQIKEATLEMG